jgi:hypothetical protein
MLLRATSGAEAGKQAETKPAFRPLRQNAVLHALPVTESRKIVDQIVF